MDSETRQELAEIFRLLRVQQEKLYEMNKALRASVEVLHKAGLRAEYEQSYEAIGSSEVALDHAGTLRLIDETIRRLTDG